MATCGQLERFHQSLKEWLADQPPATTLLELETLLDAFRWHYNVERPHQALRQSTPSEAYEATPKAAPLPAGDGTVRPRTLKISDNGTITYRKRRIQLGGQRTGLVVHVVEDDSIVEVYLGHEKIRKLLLGPKGTYHSNDVPRGRPKTRTA